MEKQEVIIPIALPVSRGRSVRGPVLSSTKVVESSFVSANPCAIATWGFTPQSEDTPSPPHDHQRAPVRGAFIGCEDGSVFLFHPKLRTKADLISPAQFNFELADTPLHTRFSTPSGVSLLGRNLSASSSQSSIKSTANPFHLSISRVVSGVTAEAVEAPKNHVDFEDEQEKLKDLLKHTSPIKERPKLPLLPLTTISAGTQPRSPTKKKSDGRVFSPTHSRTTSHPINSPSSQTSPILTPPQLHVFGDIYSLRLCSHTFPSRFGPGKAVSQLRVDESQRYVVCLQENGYVHRSKVLISDAILTTCSRDISILSAIDGSCHASARSDSPTFLPPSGMADHRTLHCAWTWKCLHVVKTQNVSTIPTPPPTP